MGNETRERIFRVAIEEFATKGYNATTLRTISKKAGVNGAAVNYYFRGKAELYASIFQYISGPDEELAKETLDRINTKEEAVEYLKKWITKYLEFRSDSDFIRVKQKIMLFELSDPSQEYETLVNKYVKPNFDVLAKCFHLYMPTETPQEIILMHLFSMLAKCTFFLAHQPFINLLVGKEFIENHRAQIITHIINETMNSIPQQEAEAGRQETP